jgi:AraC family transcriptional regulator
MDFQHDSSGYGASDDRQWTPAPQTRRNVLHRSPILCAEDFAVRRTDVVKGYSPDFQLALPYRGLFSWDVGQGTTLIDANQFLFVSNGKTFVEYQPVVEEGHASVILTPGSETLAELLVMAAGSDASIHVDVAIPSTSALRALLQHWLRLVRVEQRDKLRLDELAIATFREAMRIIPTNRPYPSALIARAKKMVHEQLHEAVSLQQLANALGVSPVYLTQTFCRAEGMPLYRYQLNLRLSRAMTELPETDDIGSLAINLGFSSHAHFSTAFKAFAKQTPSAFRDAHRKRAFSLATPERNAPAGDPRPRADRAAAVEGIQPDYLRAMERARGRAH